MGEEMWLKRLEWGEEDRNPPSVTWVGKQGGVMEFEQGSSWDEHIQLWMLGSIIKEGTSHLITLRGKALLDKIDVPAQKNWFDVGIQELVSKVQKWGIFEKKNVF